MMRKIIVDRTTWLRGEGSEPSRLLRRSDGKMCCLGSVCLAASMTPFQIEEQPSPWSFEKTSLEGGKGHGLRTLFTDFFTAQADSGSKVISVMMEINDNLNTKDNYKEAKLTRLGLLVGIDFEFVN